MTALSLKHEAARVFGQPCDVTDFSQVQALWEAVKTHYGRIDIWINNAGIAHPQEKFWELSPERYQTVVSTNIIGTMFGSKVALQGMLAQGFGAIYNMEGFGADGKRTMDGLSLYGSTKAGLHFLNRSLVKETRRTPLIIGAIRPGMVITELVTGQFEGRPEAWARFQPILHMIGSAGGNHRTVDCEKDPPKSTYGGMDHLQHTLANVWAHAPHAISPLIGYRPIASITATAAMLTISATSSPVCKT